MQNQRTVAREVLRNAVAKVPPLEEAQVALDHSVSLTPRGGPGERGPSRKGDTDRNLSA